MELQDKTLRERDFWVARGIRLPAYDRQAMQEATKRAPVWVHFGTGNLFRGYIAGLQEELLDSGAAVCGILAAETYDRQAVEQMRENDLLCLQAVLCADGTVQKRVIASVAEAAGTGRGKRGGLGCAVWLVPGAFPPAGKFHHHRKRLSSRLLAGWAFSDGRTRYAGGTGCADAKSVRSGHGTMPAALSGPAVRRWRC